MTDQLKEPTYEDVDEPDVLARPFKADPNELSTNFYWVSKAGFNLQTTIRGNPTEAEINAHLAALVKAAVTVHGIGGVPKQIGRSVETAIAPAPSNGNTPAGADKPYDWKRKDGVPEVKNGKLTLVVRAGGSEPEQVPCPIHEGKTLKRRSNDNGAWLTHKISENEWCNGRFEHAA